MLLIHYGSYILDSASFDLPILQFFPITVFEIQVPVPIEEFSPITTSCSSKQSLKAKVNCKATEIVCC